MNQKADAIAKEHNTSPTQSHAKCVAEDDPGLKGNSLIRDFKLRYRKSIFARFSI